MQSSEAKRLGVRAGAVGRFSVAGACHAVAWVCGCAAVAPSLAWAVRPLAASGAEANVAARSVGVGRVREASNLGGRKSCLRQSWAARLVRAPAVARAGGGGVLGLQKAAPVVANCRPTLHSTGLPSAASEFRR